MQKVVSDTEASYAAVRSGGVGYHDKPRGLIAVWGKEAVQFLDGLISNNMKTLEDGGQMMAAFPNAQGRLIAVVRVMRQDERFLFDTEGATRDKVFQNLFRFTYAGDFFVEDLSENYRSFSVFGNEISATDEPVIKIRAASHAAYFVPVSEASDFESALRDASAVKISDELYEVLRIESGTPAYGVDMDETTIVPELGMDGLISYTKGCYIGQEIIARIHFRGHVAKRLTGLVLTGTDLLPDGSLKNAELTAPDGKSAGRITSATISPTLGCAIALAYVRYDYLEEGTILQSGGITAEVKNLPFLK